MILLKNVSHWWEDGEISLKDINLEVNEGEFILISGKNAIACFSGFIMRFDKICRIEIEKNLSILNGSNEINNTSTF